MTPDAVRAYYAIELASAGESNRISTDTNLTDSQKAIEMKRLELEQLKASVIASGQPVTPDPSEQTRSPQRTHQMRPGDTLAGFQKALARLPVRPLWALAQGVRDEIRRRYAERLLIGGFVPMGCDGSRIEGPRSAELEARSSGRLHLDPRGSP